MQNKEQKEFLPTTNRKFCNRLFDLLVKSIAKEAEKQEPKKKETENV